MKKYTEVQPNPRNVGCKDGDIFLQNKMGDIQFKVSKEGVQEVEPPHFFALDPSKEKGTFYHSCCQMDPQTQLWGEKAKDGSYQATRLDLPGFGLRFRIEKGQLLGTGEWEGYILEPESFLPAFPQLIHKFVLRSQKTGERVVLIPSGEASSSADITQPMEFRPHATDQAKLHVFSLSKNGRCKASDREGWLYLAYLYFHMQQASAACACLKRSHSSAPFQTRELLWLQRLIKDGVKKKTLDAVSLVLQAFCLLKNSDKSPNLPWETPESFEETEQQKEVRKFLGALEIEEVFSSYRERIVQVSDGCRLDLENMRQLQDLFPSKEGDYVSPQPKTASVSSLHWEQLRDVLLACDPKTVDLELLTHHVLPIRGRFSDIEPHFLSLYAIAKNGSDQQRKQLTSWLLALRAMNQVYAQQKAQKTAIVDFLRKILLMDEKEKTALPTPEELWEIRLAEEGLEKLVASVEKISLPEPSPIAFPPVSAPPKHEVSLRKEFLTPTIRPLDRISSTALDKWVKEATKPLFEVAPVQKNTVSAFPLPPLSIAPVDLGGGKAYKEAFSQLKSRAETYQIKAAGEEVWELTKENQEKVYQQVKTELVKAQEAFRERKKALLEKVRSPAFVGKTLLIHQLEQASGIKGRCKWADLLALFAKQDANAYIEKIPGLNREAAEEIYQETAYCLMEQVRLQRLEQAQSLLVGKKRGELISKDEALDFPERSSEQVKELHRLLWQERPSYPMDRYPAILLFEAISGMLLRQDQLENLEKLADPKTDYLLEAIMGSGKSEVLLPLFAQTMADGDHLALLVLPKEQMQSGGVRLERRLYEIFEKESLQIDWQDVSFKNLQAISDRLEEARKKGQVVWLYADQLQHFFLQEQAALESHFGGDEAATKRLALFQKIRSLFKTKGVALVDEAHLQLMRKRECQKPLGKKSPVHEAFTDIAVELQILLLTDETICKTYAFQTTQTPIPGSKPFLREVDQENLQNLLVAAFVSKKYSKNSERAKAAEVFLKAKEDEVGDLLETLPKEDRAVLAFVRGQIRTILPMTLSKKWGEEYGCFPSEEAGGAPSHLAGPYRSSEPVYGSTFSTPDELLAFTIQSYLIGGVSKELLKECVDELRLFAKQKALSSQQPIELTEEYRWYCQFAGDALKESSFHRPNYAHLAELVSKDKERMRLFLLRFVLPKVEQYPKTALANGYSFVRHLKTVKAVSGTFYAPFTLHHRFTWALRPEIEGQGFVLLTKHKDPILLTEKSDGFSLLQKLLTENSKPAPRAIVDQGGMIKGAPLEIAKAILAYTKDADPKVDRVIYFDQDTQMVLERNAKAPNKYTSTQADPKTSFTFYDQARATGTDIPQADDAIALVTVHEATPFANLLQAAFRMRQLAKGQSVRFVASHELTSALQSQWTGEAITSDHLLCYAKHIQTKASLEENYKSVLEQLKELFLEECERLLDQRLDPSLFEMTLRENRLDPIASWTTSASMEDPNVILNRVKEMHLQKLASYLTPQEKEGLKVKMEALIKKALDPKKRQVPDRVWSQQTAEGGREAELEQMQEQSQIQQQQQSQQMQQQMQIQIQSIGRKAGAASAPLFDPTAFVEKDINLEERCLVDAVSATEKVPVYPAKAFLQNLLSTVPTVKAPPFLEKLPKKLLFSRDVVAAAPDERPFGRNRKAIGGVLMIPDPKEPNQPFMVALSKKESQLWMKALQGGYAPEPFDKAVLCSLPLWTFYQEQGVIAQGSEEWMPQQRSFAVEKWLMGETLAYTAEELQELSAWIRGCDDITGLEALFQNWLLPQENQGMYATSPVRKIFASLQPQPAVPTKPPIVSQPPPTHKTDFPKTVSQEQDTGRKTFFQRLGGPVKVLKKILFFPLKVVIFPFWVVWWLLRKK